MKAALQLRTGSSRVQWPDQDKARRLGADRIGWESVDPLIDPAQNGGTNVMEAVRANGFTLFLFRGLWDWTGSPEGWAAAFRTSGTRAASRSTRTWPPLLGWRSRVIYLTRRRRPAFVDSPGSDKRATHWRRRAG